MLEIFIMIKNTSELNEKDYLFLKEMLLKGEVFIYPTETIYGIGGNGEKESVKVKISEIKKRDLNKNFILLFKNIEMIEKFAFITDFEKAIIGKYMKKGGLTIILKSKKNLDDTIAARISPHPFLKKLFQYIDFPIISTSANISDNNYTHNFNKIYEIFKNKIKIFIKDDLNYVSSPSPSTIIKCENNKIKILRQGALKIPLTNFA